MPPTNSLPLFLLRPRTLCYCDVHSSFLLLHSAVEASCSPLIHTAPRYFHISEWTPCIQLDCGGRGGGGRGGGGSAMFGSMWAHQISDHAEIVIRPRRRARPCRWNYSSNNHARRRACACCATQLCWSHRWLQNQCFIKTGCSWTDGHHRAVILIFLL